MIFPNELNSGVIPKDSPVVPNADATSKIIAITGNGSKTVNNIIDEQQMIVATKMTTKDFIISSGSTSLRKIFTDCFPRENERMANITIANVVVRTPPPTLLGEAPINMSTVSTSCVATENWATSIVAKPPFRVVTD